jgi:DNA-directed RNA polymerase specialized sigma subunit
MTNYDFFNQARALNREINIELQELAILRESAINDQFGGIGGGGDGNSSTLPKSKVEIAAMRIVEAENAIKLKRIELERLQRQVSVSADKLENPVERIIIKWRYVMFKTWDEIISITGYSRRQVFRFHRDALRRNVV